MKKIINGRRYDTETAKHLGWDDASCGVTDFSYWREDLYQKKTGEFFLDGEGGPMSRYAKRVDNNSWSGSEELIPLTAEEAREWAEKHLSVDEYEAIFGAVTEDDSRVAVTMTLSAKTIELLKRMAAETGKSRGELIDQLVAGQSEDLREKAARIRGTDVRFCVIDTLEHDEFVTVCKSADEAIREADEQYSVLTESDKKRRTSFCVGTITCTWDTDKDEWKAWAEDEGDVYTVIKEYPVG